MESISPLTTFKHLCYCELDNLIFAYICLCWYNKQSHPRRSSSDPVSLCIAVLVLADLIYDLLVIVAVLAMLLKQVRLFNRVQALMHVDFFTRRHHHRNSLLSAVAAWFAVLLVVVMEDLTRHAHAQRRLRVVPAVTLVGRRRKVFSRLEESALTLLKIGESCH